jgi:hypothetical protein
MKLFAIGLLLFGLSQQKLPLDSLRVGSTELTFNYSMSFPQVAARLGTAHLYQSGDAGEFMVWVCYRTTVEGDSAILAVISSELGGGERVTSFSLFRPGRDWRIERQCASLSLPASAIVTDRGIRLGMTRAQVEERLGPPTESTAAMSSYLLIRERRGRFGKSENVEYSELSSLALFYVNGVVVKIRGDRTDTN